MEESNLMIYFYDLWSETPTTKVAKLDKDFNNINDFKDWYENTYQYYEEPFNDTLQLDITYTMITDKEEIFGVISLHKGHTFIDIAEHDDRVIVKRAFPHMICNIIGE